MKINLTLSHFLMPVILMGMMFLSCDRPSSLSPENGLKAIKILNSDLINLGDKIQENHAYSIINFLIREPSSPLSGNHGLTGLWINDTLLNMNSFKGRYIGNENGFVKVADTSVIDVDLELPGLPDDVFGFQLSEFKCEEIVTGFNFPVAIKARIESGDNEILQLKEDAIIKDNLPERMECMIKGDDFSISLRTNRTRNDKSGTLQIEISMKANGYEIVSGMVNASIGYNDKQVYFRSFDPDIRIFDLLIKGNLDYGKVDPTSKNYIHSFNDNCRIGFYESSSGQKIGDFGIGYLPDGERLGWMIYLSDGSSVLLEEHLLLANKILNYKYPNKMNQ